MDLAWNDEKTRKFVKNVGLVTTKGPDGYNIMAAEWSSHVSYAPSYMMVNIGQGHASCDYIKQSKEFGLGLTAFDQNFVASVAGGSTAPEVDKISVLKELGIEFFPAKNIDVLMVKGTAMNAECKVLEYKDVGDHVMFIGEVVEITSTDKDPIIYHNGKYWRFGEKISKPEQEVLDKISSLLEKYKR